MSISRETAGVLFAAYLAYLVSLVLNQRQRIGKEGVKASLKVTGDRPDEVAEEVRPGWSCNRALAILAAVTVALAFMSEVLTRAIEPAAEGMHLGARFAGVFLLALVGNAAEILNAVRFAQGPDGFVRGGDGGRSAQVGLVVAPVLVFLGMILAQDMNLIFSPLELIAIVLTIYLTRMLTYDGESSWLEGVFLIAVYVLFGIGFFYYPD